MIKTLALIYVQQNICYCEHLKVNSIYLKSGLNARKIFKKCL